MPSFVFPLELVLSIHSQYVYLFHLSHDTFYKKVNQHSYQCGIWHSLFLLLTIIVWAKLLGKRSPKVKVKRKILLIVSGSMFLLLLLLSWLSLSFLLLLLLLSLLLSILLLCWWITYSHALCTLKPPRKLLTLLKVSRNKGYFLVPTFDWWTLNLFLIVVLLENCQFSKPYIYIENFQKCISNK